MSFTNAMNKQLAMLNGVPAEMQADMRNQGLQMAVPFTGTAGLNFEKVTQEEVVITIANEKKVQNHIKGVHAAAMALLAETATGFAVGMNIPDDKLPLLKTMTVHYKRVAQGALKAVAALTEEQVQSIRNDDKGAVLVSCVVTDESGQEPIIAEMTWAWIPKKK